jgi:sulfur-carrier protein
MARVVMTPSLCDHLTQGEAEFEVDAANVHMLVRQLDRRFPGLAEFVENRTSIAVDGEMITSWAKPLTSSSEVLFIPRIAGG